MFQVVTLPLAVKCKWLPNLLGRSVIFYNFLSEVVQSCWNWKNKVKKGKLHLMNRTLLSVFPGFTRFVHPSWKSLPSKIPVSDVIIDDFSVHDNYTGLDNKRFYPNGFLKDFNISISKEKIWTNWDIDEIMQWDNFRRDKSEIFILKALWYMNPH